MALWSRIFWTFKETKGFKLSSIETLKGITKGIFLKEENMMKHTSYGIGGPAKAYITPEDENDLAKILKFANQNKIETYFVGSGSNLLVSDDGIDGIVITLGKAINNLKINSKSYHLERVCIISSRDVSLNEKRPLIQDICWETSTSDTSMIAKLESTFDCWFGKSTIWFFPFSTLTFPSTKVVVMTSSSL